MAVNIPESLKAKQVSGNSAKARATVILGSESTEKLDRYKILASLRMKKSYFAGFSDFLSGTHR
jgi:hypothetical protein